MGTSCIQKSCHLTEADCVQICDWCVVVCVCDPGGAPPITHVHASSVLSPPCAT